MNLSLVFPNLQHLRFSSTHHLGQVAKCSATLVNDLVKGLSGPDAADNNLVLPFGQPLVSLHNQRIQWHTEIATRLLAHVVVYLGYRVSRMLSYHLV